MKAFLSGNAVSTARQSPFRGNILSALDRLPPLLRRAHHESVNHWDPRETRWELNQYLKRGVPEEMAIHWLIQSIDQADRTEIKNFAHLWPSRFGRYPHLAAGATIQRYANHLNKKGNNNGDETQSG